eukprot:3940599-Rhodomonas_salina.1
MSGTTIAYRRARAMRCAPGPPFTGYGPGGTPFPASSLLYGDLLALLPPYGILHGGLRTGMVYGNLTQCISSATCLCLVMPWRIVILKLPVDVRVRGPWDGARLGGGGSSALWRGGRAPASEGVARGGDGACGCPG